MRPWMKVILWITLLVACVFVTTLIITAITMVKTFLI